jgi:hypothetical protein
MDGLMLYALRNHESTDILNLSGNKILLSYNLLPRILNGPMVIYRLSTMKRKSFQIIYFYHLYVTLPNIVIIYTLFITYN